MLFALRKSSERGDFDLSNYFDFYDLPDIAQRQSELQKTITSGVDRLKSAIVQAVDSSITRIVRERFEDKQYGGIYADLAGNFDTIQIDLPLSGDTYDPVVYELSLYDFVDALIAEGDGLTNLKEVCHGFADHLEVLAKKLRAAAETMPDPEEDT